MGLTTQEGKKVSHMETFFMALTVVINIATLVVTVLMYLEARRAIRKPDNREL